MKMYIWRDRNGLCVVAFADSVREARKKVKESWSDTTDQKIMLDRRPRIDKIPDAMIANLYNYTVDGLRKTPPP